MCPDVQPAEGVVCCLDTSAASCAYGNPQSAGCVCDPTAQIWNCQGAEQASCPATLADAATATCADPFTCVYDEAGTLSVCTCDGTTGMFVCAP
jgi:hypothetical protein